jgi:hypothetical protein
MNYYNKPIVWVWHAMVGEAVPGAAEAPAAEVAD